MSYNKYLPGGSINPAWAREQEVANITNDISNEFYEFINNLEFNFGKEEVNVNMIIRKEMCEICDDEYERKFNFIRNHSDSPEDLKLAREIIGI
jgi:hypothetical protein